MCRITVRITAEPSHPTARGAVAQLGERLVRNEEATGSIPVSSTNPLPVEPPREPCAALAMYISFVKNVSLVG